MPGERQSSRLLTLVFSDLVASTALKSQRGDVAAGEIIERHRACLTDLASRHDGRIVKWAGDGCFLTFETPSAAVQFALGIQAAHRSDPSLPNLRVGVHVGEVMERWQDGAVDFEGLAVDLASRVQSLAIPGQILMSTEVFNSARQQLRSGDGDAVLSWRAHGPYVLKGMDDPLGICEVGIEGLSPLAAPPNSEKASRAVQPHEEAAFGWRPAVGQPVPKRQHWILERQLGIGGFGEVWLALNTLSKDRRVFKFCFEPDRIRGLKREVVLFRVLKQKLGGHEGIARLLDWELETPPYFIEAEYTEGGDLKDWAAQHGGLAAVPMETRLDIVAQVAGALAEAHKAGVLHKDIKPANILIRGTVATPHAIITDFGIGLLLDPQALKLGALGATGLTNTLLKDSSSSTSGTAMYIAPELVEGKAPSERSDVYALGVMLYQIAVGDFSHALAPGWERDIADPLLREDIAACVDGQPEKRLQDCGQLAERLRALGRRRSTVESAQRRKRVIRRGVYAAAAVLLLLAAGASAIVVRANNKVQGRAASARNEGLPQLRALVGEEKNFEAYTLAREIEKVLPGDPTLAEYLGQVSSEINISTTPQGAKVSYKPYGEPDLEWTPIGTTPLEMVRLPLGFYRFRLELEGYEPRELVEAVRTRMYDKEYDRNLYKDPYLLEFTLHTAAETPPGMLAVDSGGLFSMDHLGMIRVEGFFVDRTEVTNRAFREFVAAGGYDKRELWPEHLVKDGVEAQWEEARASLVDQTGRPGPATWELGTYPAGQDDYPVGGVSWYEAMAYAKFRGKELPTLYHWRRAALPRAGRNERFSPSIVSLSNLEGTGPAPVGSFAGIGFSGVSDIAGNVREWCYNSDGSNRFALGGAWTDIRYMFNESTAVQPWDRSPINGLRCISVPAGASIPPILAGNIEKKLLTDADMTPVSDEAFTIIRGSYTYDHTPTNARIEHTDDDLGGVIHQLVRMASPAGSDDLLLHVYLPKDKSGPFPAVIFFPGADCLSVRKYDEFYSTTYDFIPKSGRALIIPVYKGTYERNDGRTREMYSSVQGARDLIRGWVQEIGRTADYLGERPDMDTSTLCLTGWSLGSNIAQGVPAVEDRIRVVILLSGGALSDRGPVPEINSFNYHPRVHVPVLLISGKYDYLYPVEESQKLLMKLIATPEADKRHVVLDAGHWPLPRLPMMNEMLAWLDKYQGVPK